MQAGYSACGIGFPTPPQSNRNAADRPGWAAVPSGRGTPSGLTGVALICAGARMIACS
jgi:hypothetical protein